MFSYYSPSLRMSGLLKNWITLQSPLGKFKAYYSDCPKKVCKHLRNIDTLSYELFSEARKLLIQYFPIINYSEKIFLVLISIDVRE